MKAWQLAAATLLALYIVFFALQWFDTGSAWVGHWSQNGRQNPAYWIAPLAGFFIAYLAVHYSGKELDSKTVQGFLFPFAWIVACILAFYFAVAAYQYNNYLFAQGATASAALGAAFGVAGSAVWNEFSKSPFFLFSLSGIAAWLVHWFVHR